MRKLVLGLLVALAPYIVFAQESGTGLSVGETVPSGPQPGQPFEKSVHDDWSVRCLLDQVGEERCTVYQLLRLTDGNPVAEISLFPVQSGGQAVAGANIVTPLETMLLEQLVLQVDDADAKRYPFHFCTRSGCVARVAFTALDIAAFERGAMANMTIRSLANPTEPVSIPVSLKGFTAAYDALLALN